MNRPNFLLTLISLIAVNVIAQDVDKNFPVAPIVHSTAWKVETMKDGSDCSIVTYTPREYNRTMTPRDDQDLGTFYFVSGTECAGIFKETFESMRHQYKVEQYAPVADKTLDLDSFQNINTSMVYETIGEGSTKLYLTYLFTDGFTSDPRDDKLLGMDYVVDSGDPDAIVSPLYFGKIKEDLESDPVIFNLITSNNYYKLREMIINEKLIVEKLRVE